MNADTGAHCSELAHIRQSVRDILLTPVGSRIARREYGSEIPRLIDQPLNDATLLRCAAATVMALQRWEPRIRITRVQYLIEGAALTVSLEAERIDGVSASRAALSIPLRGEA